MSRVTLVVATIGDKGKERDTVRIPFSSAERAERYAAEIKRIARRMKSDVKRVFRVEGIGSGDAERHEQTASL